MSAAWSDERVVALALAASREPASFDVLSRHEGRCVLRCPPQDGERVVLKTWSRPGVLSAARRAFGAGDLDREWRSLCRARELGVRVPTPLGRARLPANAAAWTDAMVSADIGPCVTAVDHLKRLVASGSQSDVDAFERELVAQTGAMVDGGLIDTDHGLVNTLVPASGLPVRLDFEMARVVRSPRTNVAAYGAMLGHVLATHAFAVQPATERTVRFAAELARRLDPPPAVLSRARAYVDERMRVQERRIGLAVRVELPW